MNRPVDLRQLVVERQTPVSSVLPRKRSWGLRSGIPSVIAGGFLAMVGWSACDYWLPSQKVTVLPVILTKAESQTAGTPLFQAAGWIEPRPTPVMCSALVEGIVQELLVVEGQEVQVDQPVARLIDAEVRLNLQEAESTLKLREAEHNAAQAVLTAAQSNFEQPVHLQAAHAEAEASLAMLETEIKNLPFLIRAAEARLLLASQDLEGKRAAAESVSNRAIQKAQSEFDSATAALSELTQRGPNLARQQEASARKVAALRAKLELKTDERRALEEATAHLAAAAARQVQAKLAVELAQLRLDRMTIRSPINGCVLSLHAQPGRRLMGINAASERDASTVLTLYDPDKLQVRVDVRLEDVPRVQVGQDVQISTAAAKEPLAGKVLAMTSQADIQKNTLQIKVSIDQPPRTIKPEMLAQVTVLAPPQPRRSPDETPSTMCLMVPKELIDSSHGDPKIWIVDVSNQTAHHRAIQLGRGATDQLAEVTQGLTPLDKLIVAGREHLSPGCRIRVTGIDPSLGITPSASKLP